MNTTRLRSIALATIFLLLGCGIGRAQSDSVEACKILDAPAADSSSSNREEDDSFEDQNQILLAGPPSAGILSTSPPAEYRTPESVWSMRDAVTTEREASFKPYTWTAPGVTHRNLIFEEPLLERHGFHRGELFQPVASGVKFFWRATVLPLDVIKKHHRRCDSGLGWGAPAVNVCHDLHDCQR